MHVELDGLGLFFVLEVIICEEVVQLCNNWRRVVCTLGKSWHLKTKQKRMLMSAFSSMATFQFVQTALSPSPFPWGKDLEYCILPPPKKNRMCTVPTTGLA